jgi:hypothetical protein
MSPAHLVEAELVSVLQRAVSRALRRLKCRDDDVGQEVSVHLWRQIRQGKCPHDPVHRDRWCAFVARNKALDLLRRRRRDPLGPARAGRPSAAGRCDIEELPDPNTPNPVRDLAAEIDWRQPFSADDLKRIDAWGPVPALVILSRLGLWQKVPAGRWDDWCAAAGARRPFPPSPFVQAPGSGSEVKALAAGLGVPRHTIYQICCRDFSARLQALDFVKALCREHRALAPRGVSRRRIAWPAGAGQRGTP